MPSIKVKTQFKSFFRYLTIPALNTRNTHYVENKAGLTGQTFPGRRIPGHWPTPVPEALAVAEPVTLVKG